MEEPLRTSAPILSQTLLQPPLNSPQKTQNVQSETTTTPQEAMVAHNPAAINADEGPSPTLQNVVCTVNLCCPLDLAKVNFHTRNSEYNPKRFCGVVMRLVNPRCTALIFSSGKMVVTGVRHEQNAVLACRKYARIIQKIGFPVKFTDFKIHNMVATCDLRFPLRLENFHQIHGQFSSYEPELFPALIYRMIKPRIVILIFVNGKLVITAKYNNNLVQGGIFLITPKQNVQKVVLTFMKGWSRCCQSLEVSGSSECPSINSHMSWKRPPQSP